MIWILLASLVGVLVSQLTAIGGEPEREAFEIVRFNTTQPIRARWTTRETETAQTHSGLAQFDRIERDSQRRHYYDWVIEQETTKARFAGDHQPEKDEPTLAVSVPSPSPPATPQAAAGPMKTEPTALAAGVESDVTPLLRPEASAYGLQEKTFSSAQGAAASTSVERQAAAKSAEPNGTMIPGSVQRVVHSFNELMTPVHVRPLMTVETAGPVVCDPSPEEGSVAYVDPDTQVRAISTESIHSTHADADDVRQADDETSESGVSVLEAPQIIRARPPSLRVGVPPGLRTAPMTAPMTGASQRDEKGHQGEIEAPSIVQARPKSESPQAVQGEIIQSDTTHGGVSQDVPKLAAKWPFDRIEVKDPSSVTLNVNNADVRTVFEMLARGYQMNILVAPKVEGTVTANVDGLTPEQTLQGIVKMCGLSMQEDGDMIYIYPADQIPADARQLRVFPLDFARAETLEAAVQGLLSPVGNAYTSKMNDKDNMQTQESIVVVDIPPVIAQVEEYVMQADMAPRQVLIEARVLEVELSDEMIHGINFGSILGGDATIGSFGLAEPTLSASNPVFFAHIDGSRLGAIIDLLETTTDSKTLASPRVQVINGQNARIQVGQQLGFTVATVTQTSTIQDIQFLETGVVLSVTPTISRDNRILMQVKPEVSDGEINPNTLLPEEETREVETSVLLNNHEGVIIGGLIQEKDRTVIKKLPWLGDVRFVGKFFQRREALRSRSEIIVALVPHIVEPCVLDHRSAVEYERTERPLLWGPLQRTCRPWEPRLPDSVGAERHMDVNRINRALPCRR